MAQPKPMTGGVYHAAGSRQKMMGQFIQNPTAREYSGYDWRYDSAPYKRAAKRALSHFRRRDGKRFVLEGLAATYSEPFERAYEEDDEVRQERYDSGLDYDDRFETAPGDCPCCQEYYYDERYHDGVDYTAEAESVYDYRYEMDYRNDYDYDPYDEGYSAGYTAAMRAMAEQSRRAS